MHSKRQKRRLRASAVTCALVLALSTLTMTARAQMEPASDEIAGTVLSNEDGEIVLDLGTGQGLTAGTTVEIWRPLRLKHPVTGKTFMDRFRLGTIVIDQVRQSLSLAHANKLTRAAERGDIVIIAKPAPKIPVVIPPPPIRIPIPPPAPPPPSAVSTGAAAARGEPAPTPASKPAPPPPDDGARQVQAMLEALQGTDIPTRVARYKVFVDAHPSSPYSAVLREEITVLESTRAAPPTATSGGEIRQVKEVGPLLVKSFTEPAAVLPGRPLRLSIELTDDTRGAVLQLRKKGTEGYRSIPMHAEGLGYYGVTIPAKDISDTDLEYFIDGTRDGGTSTAAIGSPDHPKVLSVIGLATPTGPEHLDATASAWTDFADYNRLRGNDRVWQTEGYFGVRLGDIGVRAVRLGFGVYRGVGGSTYDLDVLDKRPRSVGLTYGYFETEWGFIKDFSIITRASVGLLDQGISGGGQFLFRIGNDLHTNLLLGGEFLGGVGVRSIAELDLNVFPRFPIALRTEVSDQPAGTSSSHSLVSDVSDGKSGIGARGIAQLGFRVIPPMLLFVRGSVEGRTIQHAGPGAGGGITVSW